MAPDFDRIEKKAITAVQKILNNRGEPANGTLDELQEMIDQLPPYRALIIYGHVLSTISKRLPDGDAYKQPLHNMGVTITKTMGRDYVNLIETDPEFYKSQKKMLADNLEKIGQLMERIATSWVFLPP